MCDYNYLQEAEKQYLAARVAYTGAALALAEYQKEAARQALWAKNIWPGSVVSIDFSDGLQPAIYEGVKVESTWNDAYRTVIILRYLTKKGKPYKQITHLEWSYHEHITKAPQPKKARQ